MLCNFHFYVRKKCAHNSQSFCVRIQFSENSIFVLNLNEILFDVLYSKKSNKKKENLPSANNENRLYIIYNRRTNNCIVKSGMKGAEE